MAYADRVRVILDFMQRKFVTFKSEFFHREDKTANLSENVFYGQFLAAYIADELREKKFEVEEPYMEDFAWAFHCKIGEQTFWLHVGEYADVDTPDNWLIVINSTLGFVARALGQKDEAEIKKMCQEIHEILVQNERIGKIMWYTEEQFNQSDVSGISTPE